MEDQLKCTAFEIHYSTLILHVLFTAKIMQLGI